jgi:hypothetical protein
MESLLSLKNSRRNSIIENWHFETSIEELSSTQIPFRPFEKFESQTIALQLNWPETAVV